LFKYRCSYLIESRAFAALPEPALRRIARRMSDMLQSESPEAPYDRISAAERRTLVEILREIKPELLTGERRHVSPPVRSTDE
jgi:hypothetical protein